MGMAEELQRLDDLHRAGSLSDLEYERAKARVLDAPPPGAGGPDGSGPPTAPGAPVGSGGDVGQNANQWCMFMHLSTFASFVVPFGGIIGPLVMWQMKKDELAGVDVQGKIIMNWMISWHIYMVISVLLVFVVVGIVILPILGILGIVFPIIGAIKANGGETWPYPMSIRFFS
ncbi:MAG: DUF4870 domain-containing protein [Phycisphaerales bacterium]|nr:DUF4870 domain-containing protein [Phycisphaerales bacterium]